MTKQEELEKIEKQIKDAQEKLSDIMTAINRERLVEEKITKSNIKAKEEIKKIEDELEKITSKFNFESEAVSQKEDELDSIISGLDKEIGDKNLSLENIKKMIKKEEENLISIKDKAFIEMNENKRVSDNFEKKSKEKIDSLNQEITFKENILLELDHKLSSNKLQIDNTENKLKTLTSELEMREIELDSVHSIITNFGAEKEKNIQKIDELKDTIIELGEGVKGYEFELSEIKKQVDIAKSELFDLEKEKSDFIKAKFNLARQKEDLQMKEEFIKDKYQQAGINY